MKTYTVYFSEPVTVKYKGDKFNKELKKWEYDVECEEVIYTLAGPFESDEAICDRIYRQWCRPS